MYVLCSSPARFGIERVDRRIGSAGACGDGWLVMYDHHCVFCSWGDGLGYVAELVYVATDALCFWEIVRLGLVVMVNAMCEWWLVYLRMSVHIRQTALNWNNRGDGK